MGDGGLEWHGGDVAFKSGRRDVGVPGGDVFFVFTPYREAGLSRPSPAYFLLYLWDGCEFLSETVRTDELPF
jgi:hypothetical protein